MITCRECGAPIEELAERCPYCGAINELGAEHKYMQDMYNLKDDLKEVGNIPSEEIKAEVSGLYIVGVKGIRGNLETPVKKKKGFFARFKKSAKEAQEAQNQTQTKKSKKK